jgi:hypothetical protein
MTHPLPHAAIWWAWQSPAWVHRVSALATFAIELAAPFLILAPRRLRHAGALAMLALQVVIGATGNYGFFNLLTIVLCLALLDDHALRCWLPWGRAGPSPPAASTATTDATSCGAAGELPAFVAERRENPLKRLLLPLFAVPVLLVGALQVHDAFVPTARVDRAALEAGVSATFAERGTLPALRVLEAQLQPFLSLNAYGLFRVMTTTRPEIVVQGSADGRDWFEYDFRWKPDDPAERPSWVQPHMPRLDWRLWFEALAWERYAIAGQRHRPSAWFGAFLTRLLEHEPTVVALLGRDPFPDGPPAHVRASLFDYRFATPPERAGSGAFWVRRRIDPTWLQLSAEPR